MPNCSTKQTVSTGHICPDSIAGLAAYGSAQFGNILSASLGRLQPRLGIKTIVEISKNI
jgi:hypothetical protein